VNTRLSVLPDDGRCENKELCVDILQRIENDLELLHSVITSDET